MHFGILIALTAGICAASACATAPSRRDDGCTVHSIDEVVSNAVALAGKMFCGDVSAVEYGRTARILNAEGQIPPSSDLAMLVSSKTRVFLVGLSATPERFYIEARLDPMIECFAPSASGEDCSPYRRPIVFHIRSAHRRQ